MTKPPPPPGFPVEATFRRRSGVPAPPGSGALTSPHLQSRGRSPLALQDRGRPRDRDPRHGRRAREGHGPRANAGDEPKAPLAPVGSGVAAIDSSRPRPFQGLLDNAKDNVPIEALEQSDAYRTLLWNLKNYPVAEVTSLAETISAEELLRSPAEYRGHFVRVSGVLVRELAPERLTTNAAGFDTRWRSFIVDELSGDGNNAFMFDLFTKPERDFTRKDAVTVEGVFLQIVTYDARSGKKRVPFIEARNVALVVGEKAAIGGSTNVLLLLAILLATLPLVAYGLQTFSRRKNEKALVDALAKVRARHPPHFKKRDGTPSDAAAPAAVPPPLPAPTVAPTPEAPPAAPSAPAPANGPEAPPPS